jgi:hypothetical protein
MTSDLYADHGRGARKLKAVRSEGPPVPAPQEGTRQLGLLPTIYPNCLGLHLTALFRAYSH